MISAIKLLLHTSCSYMVQPYLTAGYGLMSYKIDLVTTAGVQQQFNGGDHVREAFIPIGAGLKFVLSNSMNLDMGYKMNFVDGDNLDGYRAGSQNDKFSYSHIGLEFLLGGKTKPALSSYNPVAALEADNTKLLGNGSPSPKPVFRLWDQSWLFR